MLLGSNLVNKKMNIFIIVSVLCNKTYDWSHFSPAACFPISKLSAVMAGILHRTLRLRTAVRLLSPHSSLTSTTIARLSHVELCSPVLLTSSWRSGVCYRKLHAGADGSRQSPAAAPERRPFSKVTEEDLNFFRKILPDRTITDPDLLESSNVDWLKSVRGEAQNWINSFYLCDDVFHISDSVMFTSGSSEVLLRPQTTEEVSQILR